MARPDEIEVKSPMRCQIAGASFHPGATAIVGKLQNGHVLRLRRDPANVHDKNAVGIYYTWETPQGLKGRMLGYTPRGVSEWLAPLMDGGVEVKITFIKHRIWGYVELTWEKPNAQD